MEKIRFENVKKKYLYGANALNDVGFSLEKGRRMTVFGGEGAGKTTLLKVVAGLTDFEGNIYLDDKDIRKISVKDRRISMTFADAFKPRKSVYENLFFSFKIRGIEAKIFEEKLRKIDEIFGVGYLYFWKFKDLNQRQKAVVTIIRCLVRDAELYLLDDPLKGLTKSEKRDFLLKTLSYLDGERTLIYATDDLDEARLLNFYTVILNCGYVGDSGFFEDIRKAPAELSVCRLLGINVFEDGDKYIAVKPEDLRFKKSENTEPENNFYGFGASAKLIGIENCSMHSVYNFVSSDDERNFFGAYVFHSDGGSIPPKIGDIYELFYDETKALFYGISDEKLIKQGD
jgi:multiple sugar transport system ATP-binding protein